MIVALTFAHFAREYAYSRPLSEQYRKRLISRARSLERHCGCAEIGQILSERNVNSFLASVEHLSPRTVRSYREDLLVLWNSAGDDDLAPYPITRRIRSVPLPELLIDCYVTDEIRALVEFSRTLKGAYANGVAKRLYWPAAIQLAWEAGLRRGDVWRFRRDAVHPDGTLRIIQGKTKHLVVVRLRPATIAALDAIGLPHPCEWTLAEDRFTKHFRKIVRGAGVNRGTFKWIRRASGSYVEAAHPGAGYKHLGHKSPAVFNRHYDARLGAATLPLPPEL